MKGTVDSGAVTVAVQVCARKWSGCRTCVTIGDKTGSQALKLKQREPTFVRLIGSLELAALRPMSTMPGALLAIVLPPLQKERDKKSTLLVRIRYP